MEEKKKEETEAEAAVQNAFNNQRQPNIIGNAEDMQNVQPAEEEKTPHLGGVDVQMEQPFGGEGGQFADITGQLTRSKRKRGKSPI